MAIKVGDRLPEGTLTEMIVRALNVEQPGKFEVSDADTMLKAC